MAAAATKFGSLKNYEKGGVVAINDDPKHYVFSNVFDVASKSKPYERVVVGLNVKYTMEATRAEGDSPWYACSHDEAAIVMDGEVEVHLIKPDQPLVPESKEGAIKLGAAPAGKNMGWLKARRGHMALLPKGSAYQFRVKGEPGVLLIQSMLGDCSLQRWAEICQK